MTIKEFKSQKDHQYAAIQIIGASIQTYNHFEDYSIPDETSKGLDKQKLSKDKFLEYVYNYYVDKSSINLDYGDDLKYQNDCKTFMINRINENSYEVGKDWLYSAKFNQ